MPGKTTHSISLRGTTHATLMAYCQKHGLIASKTVDAWVHEFAPFTDRQPHPLPRDERGRFAEPHPVDPEPVDREPEVEILGSDIVEPSHEGLVPFEKKTVRGGGYNEF